MLLVQFGFNNLQNMINDNRHAYIQCSSTDTLPLIECGTISQQRFRLIGQKSISHFSIYPVHNPSSSSSSVPISPATYTIVAAGTSPCICTYNITCKPSPPSIGSKAVSVAVSLYGAVKSLASSLLPQSLTH